MQSIQFYKFMSRFSWLNYRAKVMVVAFLGTHIPLLCLIGYVAAQSSRSPSEFVSILLVALGATLAGTAATLFALNLLLRPVMNTKQALRGYREHGTPPTLPTIFTDDAGTLMADAQTTMTELDASIRRLETIDSPTGLLNRDGFGQWCDSKTDRQIALTAIRLCNSEQIVQSFGRDALQNIMAELAGRLAGQIDDAAMLARASEGHFLIGLPITGETAGENTGENSDIWQDTAAATRELIGQIAAEVSTEKLTVRPILSAGIVVMGDGDAISSAIDDVLAAASQASESAPLVLHSSEASDRLRARFVMEQDLRAAIDRNEFELHFQPVMDVQRGRAVSAEALIRWNHPQRGLVSPGLFIPIAEDAGLIDAIGLWVLREACERAARWNNDLAVAVNLSAKQFMDQDLVGYVADAMNSAGLRADRLELELTETVAMTDQAHTKAALTRLRDMGVSIAIDDFGTGYASMSTLSKLPFHKLKIDREFVTDIDTNGTSQAICDAMIALGQGLGIKVLAEGTETAAEVSHLQSRGCALFQGFFFSKPVPAQQFEAAVTRLDGLEPRHWLKAG